MGGEQACRRVELAQPPDDGEQHVLAFAAFEQVDLGQHDPVGHRHLLHRFGVGVERRHAIVGIDDGDDALETAGRKQAWFAHDCMKNGGGVGQSRRFDHDAVEGLDLAAATPRQQVVDGVDQITANGAAQAAGGQFDDVLVSALDQQVVDTDIAELIDDDGGIGKERILEQEVEKRCLAGTKEASEDRNGDGSLCHVRQSSVSRSCLMRQVRPKPCCHRHIG